MASVDYENIDNDILIDSGDFVKSDCNQSHINDIIISNKGDYKQHPLIGLGLVKYVNGPDMPQNKVSLAKQIRLQLEADGFKVTVVDTTDFSNIKIEASK